MIYNLKDAYYRKAKKEGYRSRSAYKLQELNRRFQLIRSGNRVVDMGAAPGGWLQVTSRLVGPKGKVIGIDLQSIDPINEKNVVFLKGDITSENSLKQIKEHLGSFADCLISDLSPRLSGVRDTDISRSVELAVAALEFAHFILKPGGSFLLKTFMGQETEVFAVELKRQFDSLQRNRPDATRKASSEIYFIAKGFKASKQNG